MLRCVSDKDFAGVQRKMQPLVLCSLLPVRDVESAQLLVLLAASWVG